MCFCHGRPAIVCSHCGLWFLTHFVVGLALLSDWQFEETSGPPSYAYGLAIDSNGPVVAGSTSGSLYNIHQGGKDWWIMRFNDAGTPIGASQWGEPDDDIAWSLAVDANDNLWSAGWTGGPSARAPFIFKMVPPSYNMDIYDRSSSSGAAYLGGITIDSSGNAIAVGGSTGTIDGLTSSGDYDFLLVVYSNAGVKQFTRLTGSSAQDDAYSVTTDSSDNIVVLGETSGSMSGFTNAGVGDDVAVLKYDSSGTLLWTYQWGSASDDWFKCVKTDSSDNIYAAGITVGSLTGANAGGYDVGVFKLNSAAVQQWVVQRGSAGTDQAFGMALDLTNGLLYVSGTSDGELDGRTNPTASAAFVMVFDLGGTWQSTSFFQGSGSSQGWGVVLTASLDLFLAGSANGVHSLWKILTTSTTTTVSSSSTASSTTSSSFSTTSSTRSTVSSSSTTSSTTSSSSSTTSSTSSTVSSSSTTSSTTSSCSSTTVSSTTLSTSSTVSSSSTTRSITSSSKTKTSTSSTETGSSTTSRSQTISSTTSSSATSISTSSTSAITTTRNSVTTTATRPSTTTSTTSSISFTTSLFFTNSSSGSTTRTSSTRNTHSVSSTSVSVSSTRTINRAASTTLMMNSTATSTTVSPATLPLMGTSTVTVTSARNVASEILLKFEENQKDLVQQLLENATNGETGVPVSTEEPDGTLVFGVAMSVPENATDRITVSAPNGLSLGVPTTLLAAAGGSVALSVAQLGQDSKMVQALEALDEEELTVRLAARPVSVVLFSADGREWSGPLPAPLELVIPVVENQTEDGKVGACAFWDLEVNMWSTEGVTTLSISDGLVTCETRHLSLFGFVLRTIGNIFACSAAVAIFSLDGLKNLVKGGMWMRSIPALMHWAVVLVAGILLFKSWRYDKQHERYLKELKQASEAHRFQQRLRQQRLQRRSSTMQLASLKQLLPEEIVALRLPKVSRFSIHFYSMVVRQETGQTLADLEGLHSSVGLVAAHVKAYNSIMRFCSSSALGKANTLYTANNAWIRWSEPCPVHSCVFRCLLHFALLYSKWAVAAVFFNFSARAADENCQAFFQLSPEMIIRSVFVSTLSTLLGIVPFLLLVLLSKCPREPKCFTRVGNLIAFAYVWLYAVTCIMVVSIFLSSVHLDDAWKWFVTGFTGFISSLLLIPIILMSLGLTLLTFYQVDPDDLCSWRKEGRLLPLRLQISIPPETRSLLLQQINGAEHLLVVCDVAGIPEKTVTLQKTGSAEWSSSQPFSIRDRQELQISFLAQTGDWSSELGSISLESEKCKGSHRQLPLIPSLDPSLEAFVDVEIVEIASEVERDRMDDGMDDGMENMVVDVVGDGSNLPVPETEVVDFVDMEDLVSEEGIKTARV